MVEKPRVKRVRFPDDAVIGVDFPRLNDVSQHREQRQLQQETVAAGTGTSGRPRVGRGKGGSSAGSSSSSHRGAGGGVGEGTDEERQLGEWESNAVESIAFHLLQGNTEEYLREELEQLQKQRDEEDDEDEKEGGGDGEEEDEEEEENKASSSSSSLLPNFHPDYCHQLFGEEEIIYGYKDLKIDLYMHVRSYVTYIDVRFSQKFSGPKRKRQADDLTEKWKEFFPSGYFTSRDEFVSAALANESEFRQMLLSNATVLVPWKRVEVTQRDDNHAENDDDNDDNDGGDQENDDDDGVDDGGGDDVGGKDEGKEEGKEGGKEGVDEAKDKGHKAHGMAITEQEETEQQEGESSERVREHPHSTTIAAGREKSTQQQQQQQQQHEEGQAVAEAADRDKAGVGAGEAVDVQVVQLDLANASVRAWHARLQPLVRFFIDNGLPIDVNDPLWLFYIVLERSPRSSSSSSSSSSNGGSAVICSSSAAKEAADRKSQEAGEAAGAGPSADQGDSSVGVDMEGLRVVGFCTLYQFYHYPDSTRLRLSQVLIAPPFQRRGHGTRVLLLVAQQAQRMGCFDVTVEDASDSLQNLREAIDVVRMLSFPRAVAAVETALAAVANASTATIPKAEDPAATAASSNASKSASADGDAEGLAPAAAAAAASVEEGRQASLQSREGNGHVRRSTRVESLLHLPNDLIESVRKEFQMHRKQTARCWEVLLYLSLPTSGSAGRRAWRRLVWSRVLSEELGAGREEECASRKKLVDLKVFHDGLQMFFMTKRAPNERGEGDEEEDKDGDGEGEGEGEGRKRRRGSSGMGDGRGGQQARAGSGGVEFGEGEMAGLEDMIRERLQSGVRKEVTDEEEQASRQESLKVLMEEREENIALVADTVKRLQQSPKVMRL